MSPPRWIPQGETVSVAGIAIAGGLFYCGRIAGRTASRVENCFVNPALKVGPGVDQDGATMPYWPSYSEIGPAARHAYLQWLSSDRSSLAYGIGYVFLYFYGLERRLLVERKDASILRADVRRLVGIYGDNGSFRRYANQLLEFTALFEPDFGSKPEIGADLRADGELSLRLRVYLGRKLAAEELFDADDALIWFLGSPETSIRTPVHRCFDEFRALWDIRFAERYPKGLKVSAPKKRLGEISYRSASGTFTATTTIDDGLLPDIATLSAPLAKLGVLAEAICAELDSFSRLIGKKPQARATAEGAALLPSAMLLAEGQNALKSAKEALDRQLGGSSSAIVALPHLLGALGLESPEAAKLPAPTASQLASVMDKVGIGFEPDRRYGGAAIGAGDSLVIFRAEAGGPVDYEDDAFKAARALVDVTALAAAADGTVTGEEVGALMNKVRSIPSLGQLERARLFAHAAVALRDTRGQNAVMKKLAQMSEPERRRIGNAAIAAVRADGHAAPEEIKFIERLWKALGLAEAEVYSALHRGGIFVDEPVSIAPATAHVGSRIPPPKRNQDLAFDEVRLARIVSETKEVSALLAGIFSDEAGEPLQRRKLAESRSSAFEGLDGAHSALLLQLLSDGRTPRSAFDMHARELRLLPDGAFATLNEWGFDTFGEEILEEGADVNVAGHLVDGIAAARKAA